MTGKEGNVSLPRPVKLKLAVLCSLLQNASEFHRSFLCVFSHVGYTCTHVTKPLTRHWDGSLNATLMSRGGGNAWACPEDHISCVSPSCQPQQTSFSPFIHAAYRSYGASISNLTTELDRLLYRWRLPASYLEVTQTLQLFISARLPNHF